MRKEIQIWFIIASIIGIFQWLNSGVFDELISARSIKILIISLSGTYFIFGHIFIFQLILHSAFGKSLLKLKRIWNEVIAWLVAMSGFLFGFINLSWFGPWIYSLFFPSADTHFSFDSWWFIYAVISFIIVSLIGSFILYFFTMKLNIDESYRILYEQERLKKEMDTARQMQIGLMPASDPDIEGFDISGICIPANETGGDCFDYLWMDETRNLFGIAVADISGKGLRAAMTAVMLSGLILRESISHPSPSELLSSINQPVFHKSQKSTFASVVFAVIDIRNKILTFANAGQMPPLLLRDGKVEVLNIDGIRLPLGIKSNVKYNEKTLSLKSGDLLLFYTDGVNETINSSKELFNNERLKQILEEQTKSMRASEIIDSIIDETKAFRKEYPQNDDLTIVAVCVK